ncbi:MAG: ankyrin repeat domain-containing protein [Janthinobacterium lividum]
MTDQIETPTLPPLPSVERLRELMSDAARTGRNDVIPALLSACVEIDGHDAKGHTALILASYNGQASTTALLLAEGAAVDGAEGVRGNTALMGVAFKGHNTIASMLIDAGADVNRRNWSGQTALMNAALFNHVVIVDMLLAAGADATVTDDIGNSAFSVSAAQDNQAMILRLSRSQT